MGKSHSVHTLLRCRCRSPLPVTVPVASYGIGAGYGLGVGSRFPVPGIGYGIGYGIGCRLRLPWHASGRALEAPEPFRDFVFGDEQGWPDPHNVAIESADSDENAFGLGGLEQQLGVFGAGCFARAILNQ